MVEHSRRSKKMVEHLRRNRKMVEHPRRRRKKMVENPRRRSRKMVEYPKRRIVTCFLVKKEVNSHEKKNSCFILNVTSLKKEVMA